MESEAYVSLQNPIELTIDTMVSYYQMPIPFPFKAFKTNIGDSVLISMNGFVLAGDDENGFAFDPYVVNTRYKDQNSQVAYEFSGNAGTRIFKVQWKDMGVKNMPNESINMQVWFKEANGDIEFHFGNSNCGALSQSGIFFLEPDFSAVREYFWLGGDPDQPVLNDPGKAKIEGIPSAGTVYRFAAKPNGIDSPKVALSLNCFPNPSYGKFQLSQPGIIELNAMDMMGRSIEVLFDGEFFALPASASGVHFLSGRDEHGNWYQGKILILDVKP